MLQANADITTQGEDDAVTAIPSIKGTYTATGGKAEDEGRVIADGGAISSNCMCFGYERC